MYVFYYPRNESSLSPFADCRVMNCRLPRISWSIKIMQKKERERKKKIRATSGKHGKR